MIKLVNIEVFIVVDAKKEGKVEKITPLYILSILESEYFVQFLEDNSWNPKVRLGKNFN